MNRDKQSATIHRSHRQPQRGALSLAQNEEKRSLSQSQVVCKNALAGVERDNASTIYRKREARFDGYLILT